MKKYTFRKRFLNLSQELNEFLALEKIHDKNPSEFRRWVEEDKEWLFEHDVATLEYKGEIVGVYPMEWELSDGVVLFDNFPRGMGVCTSCAAVLPKEDLVDMVQKNISDNAPFDDGVRMQVVVDSARQEYSGEYWCEDCIEYYYNHRLPGES